MTTATVTSEPTGCTEAVPKWDTLPCVQYGFPDGVGPIRSPKLRTIFEPIPEGANTASPVYLLPREEYKQQDRYKNGYDVKGASTIAKKLQDECEADDHVLYPIHIESDVYHEEGPETLLSWFCEFVEDCLDVPFSTCTLYFSGNRSIHVHVPRFVSEESDREQLKEEAKEFCERTGANLDLGLYSRKRMFRLPGVEHEKTGLPKVEIESTWDKTRIFRESNESNPDVPATYAEVLQQVFVSQESLTVSTDQILPRDPQNLFRVLDSEKTVLEFAADETAIETPLIEQIEYPEDAPDVPEWAMYNTKEFSPYAFASGNPRSVAALRVKRGPFARKKKRNGATMVPAYFYGAVGCNGDFTKKDVHAPLQLSKKDYRKWDFESGDTLVIIGGKSGSSRLLDVDPWEARVVGHALTGENGNREAALDYLSEQGYDVGASSPTSTTTSSGGTASGEGWTIFPARSNPQSQAERFQRKAEQEGIETLTHNERIRVACRHLRQGWKPTWEWFKEQYGADFKPDVTYQFLRGIVEDDGFDEYDHIDLPETPP